MILGLTLGICLALFITSFIFIITGVSHILTENLMTGAAIGTNQLIYYSLILLIISFIGILSTVILLLKKVKSMPQFKKL